MIHTRYHVYLVRALNKIKIGCSINPIDRIMRVTEWVPFPCATLAIVPGCYKMEAALHSMFADEWSHGEWFEASPRLVEFAARMGRGEAVEIDEPKFPSRLEKRRVARAEKIGISKHRHLFPQDLRDQLRDVLPGHAIPRDVLAKAQAIVAKARAT